MDFTLWGSGIFPLYDLPIISLRFRPHLSVGGHHFLPTCRAAWIPEEEQSTETPVTLFDPSYKLFFLIQQGGFPGLTKTFTGLEDTIFYGASR